MSVPSSNARRTSASSRSPEDVSAADASMAEAPSEDFTRDLLPELFDTSARLFRHLQSPEQGPRWRYRRDAYYRLFEATARELDRTSNSFIDGLHILRRLGNPLGDRERYTIDAIRAANLARLAYEMSSSTAEKPERLLESLESLDADLAPSVLFNEDMLPFGLALDAVTQKLIFELQNRPDATHSEVMRIMARLFCHPEVARNGGLSMTLLKKAIGSGPYRSVGPWNVKRGNPDYRREVRSRIEQIQDLLLSPDGGSSLTGHTDHLEAEFPFSDFVNDLRTWAEGAFDDVEKDVERMHDPSQAGVASPALSVGRDEPPRRLPADSMELDDTHSDGSVPQPPLTGSRSLFRGPKSVQRLLEIERQLLGTPPSHQRDETPPEDYTDIPNDAIISEMSRRRVASAPLTMSSGSAAPGSSLTRPYRASSARYGDGRTPVETISESEHGHEFEGGGGSSEGESDDGFQADVRRSPRGHRLRPGPPPRRAGVREARGSPPRASASASASASRNTVRSGSPVEASQRGSAFARSLPLQASQFDLKSVEQRSRQMKAEVVPPPVQSRTPWSQPDVDVLVQAVYVHQCRWSSMEEYLKDYLKHPRNQQAIRDKARQVKTHLLKTDQPLFKGFDLITLGKKEKEAIILLGRNPDRKEADVDPDDEEKATNTRYLHGSSH